MAAKAKLANMALKAWLAISALIERKYSAGESNESGENENEGVTNHRAGGEIASWAAGGGGA